MKAIETVNLTKRFGNFVSVDDISFSVDQGEVFGFLGANGAGKSTTIRMLCGILSPSSGDAMVGGYSIVEDPSMVKKSIGYMSQRFSLYNDLTVEENISFFAGVYGISGTDLKGRKAQLLKNANLEGLEKTITGDLPGGVKQRLALGTAVIHRPPIVFLDEPTSGVDPVSRRIFWDLIRELSDNGTTVFVTTHYLEEAEYCSNIIFLNAGRIIAEGSPGKIKSDAIRGQMYHINCSPLIPALQVLPSFPGTIDVSAFGNSVHLLIGSGDHTRVSDEIVRYLTAHTITVGGITTAVPSLEDVFIHLLEKENK